MRKYILVLLLFLIFSSDCQKKQKICPVFFPVQEKAKLTFVSYVANAKNDMLHPFEYFERQYIYTDTVNHRAIHHYIERNKLSAFYTDDFCSIFHRITVDLSAYAVSFGFQYQDSAYFSYWKPVIKVNKGIGTSWNVTVDTLFSAMDHDGQEHWLRYNFNGEAEFKGQSKVVVPFDRLKQWDVMHVQWNKIKYFLYDQTNGDSLLLQEGNASDYFDPQLGLIRSVFDYHITLKGKPKEFRKSTLELSSTYLPKTAD
ncbi:MAG: hypothetical protein MUC94_05990 [bacterium]|nr:hypothetical protein [bacterium]